MHALAQDEEGAVEGEVGMQRRAGGVLHAMLGPQGLVAVMEAFRVKRLRPSWLAANEAWAGDASPGSRRHSRSGPPDD